ncbi:HNH endonuclease [Arthrobacter sp. TMS1-12-1]
MRTSAEHAMELDRISDRITSLSAEKARIDAELAASTEELRKVLETRMMDHFWPGRPGPHRTNLADTTTATEIACLLRISERSAHRLVQYSALLVNYHPRTLTALRDGTISWSHATTLLHECTGLPHHVAARLEDALLPIAADTTVPRLSYRARRLRTELHPEALEKRARTAVQGRRVDVEAADDAMAWLHVHLPATDAAAIDARLTQTSRALQIPAESRTLPQLRTDVLTDLLLDGPARSGCAHEPDDHSAAGHAYRIRAHINVTVPVLTLLGVDDAPADLEGYGPIPSDIARRLAAHAPSFTRLLTHPETGAVLSVGRDTYAVPADLKKWLRVRDRTCRHPGCSIPAARCELDHTTPWARGGPTDHDNLAHLCRKHHMLKSEGLWHYDQPTPGTLVATSPAGRSYACDPEPPPF